MGPFKGAKAKGSTGAKASTAAAKANARAKAAAQADTLLEKAAAEDHPMNKNQPFIGILVSRSCLWFEQINICNLPTFLFAQEPTKRRRTHLGRRSDEAAVDRIIADKFGNLDLVYRETHKVDGLVLRERILADKRALPEGQRLGATYYAQLAMEWAGGQASFAKLKPAIAGEAISDGLIQALECCAKTNPASRSTEPLESILRHQGPMNQTEVYGMVKAIISNSQMGQIAKDAIILEVMHYLIRTDLAEAWPPMMQVHWVMNLNRNNLNLVFDVMFGFVLQVVSFA
jgi:hypothetical protein